MTLPTLKLIADSPRAEFWKVFLDDSEIRGIRAVRLTLKAGELADLELDVRPGRVEIDGQVMVALDANNQPEATEGRSSEVAGQSGARMMFDVCPKCGKQTTDLEAHRCDGNGLEPSAAVKRTADCLELGRMIFDMPPPNALVTAFEDNGKPFTLYCVKLPERVNSDVLSVLSDGINDFIKEKLARGVLARVEERRQKEGIPDDD